VAGALRGSDLVLLLALGVVWGAAFVFITLGLRGFSPVLMAALRFDITGAMLLGLAMARRRGALVPRGGAQWRAVGIAAVLNVAAYHAFLFWGQQATTAGIAAVIVGLNPVLTTVFSRALLPEERVGAAGLAGLGLGFGGIVLLATLKPGSLLDARGIGELAVLLAIASWALGSVLVKRAQHGMDVFAFIGWHGMVGAGILHVAALAFEGGGHATWSAGSVGALLYLAVLASGGGFLLYFTLLERVGPIRSNLVSYIAPLVATLTGAVFLHDALELRGMLAFALIACAFALVARPSGAKQRAAAA